ncbi:E3 ubiquitin-protein ligase SINA-like 10 [Silene latifolia]|uniref:E3 ubiquitin-protein ligase SINA-like 10 n=1 Tax=Silene latifolia TaxID=37657 RepID=UPI003D76DA49
MAKFSVEEEDDEEFCVRSPKRIRTSSPLHDHHHQEQDQSNDDDETNSTARTNNSSGGPVSVILSDPDVLDCSICFEPLTVPVFQCDNGHIACSTCCNNLGNKCPSCCGKIGNNRCRAIEKVIESVKVSCCYIKNGCKETVSYCKKHEHEEKCSFAPCLCPFTSCLFRGSPRKLSHHMSKEHSDLVVRFRYNSIFSVSLGMSENFLVLQEEKDGIVFILSHGNTVTLRCLHSGSSKVGFKYDIVLSKGCSSLKFQSSTHFSNGQLSMPPSVDYVMVPGYFYDTSGRLKLEICVWSKDASTWR